MLFYVRLVADIAGRVVPRRFQAASPRPLLAWAFFKAALLPPLLACIFHPPPLFGDAATIALVAAFWFLSGYVNAGAYLTAPLLVPPAHKSRAGSLMALVFQASCFSALLAAYALQRLALGGESTVQH